MAKGDTLPPDDEVARWIKPRHLGKDDAGNIIVGDDGRPKIVAPDAFGLADDEDGLSVTWLQFFGPDRQTHLPLASEAFRKSIPSQRLSDKSAFAIARIAAVLDAARAQGVRLRAIHDPVLENDGHSELRRYPVEMGLLQLHLSETIFEERHLYGKIRVKGWSP